ncbi:MAG: DUF2530 domain-containing protein [Actinobacteria bacterium]|nr:DUF2530 domain-containing protein [Actinomycetota bacterium]
MGQRERRQWRPDPEPLRWPATLLLGPLMGLWALALIVTLLVPALHTGERSWWPWCCIIGLALGALGYGYLRRGRGNAADA